MMRKRTIVFLIVTVLVFAAVGLAQTSSDVITVTDFQDEVVDPGGENEDWQPAFQAAIEKARETQQPIYVPVGEYAIRRAIEIEPVEVERTPFVRNYIYMFGADRFKTKIAQKGEGENCIDWTGPDEKNPALHGHLANMTIAGGEIGLNIKYHNRFHLENCYIVGASYGIYTEGYSSRFEDCVVRWCKKAGFFAGGHFNDNIIRDFYFSRNVVGIRFHGVHGSRVESCAFEGNAKAAIIMSGVRNLTLNNSYFEGNGYANVEILPAEGVPNTVMLDRLCRAVSIHDNIFRKNIDDRGALLAIADLRQGHIYDNYFYNYNPGGRAVMLYGESELDPEREAVISDLVFEHNAQENFDIPFSETEPGLLEAAIENGSSFDWELTEPKE
ncbi:MAG: right-handed parallel beta-helix repeat-containing protein [Armatimonadota bacterium]